MEPAKKRQRLCLNISEKLLICEYADRNSGKSQQDIADHFSELWSKDIKRRTVGDVIQSKQKWQEFDQKSKRVQTGKFPDVETALYEWFRSIRAQNIPLTDDLLKEKARKFASQLNVTDFSASTGWVTRFKQRHGISCKLLSGESSGVDQERVNTGREKAKERIQDYQPKDIFNMDETGLFFRLLPDKTLSNSKTNKGVKKQKDRITIALCANSDGSEKVKPFVIGKPQNQGVSKTFK